MTLLRTETLISLGICVLVLYLGLVLGWSATRIIPCGVRDDLATFEPTLLNRDFGLVCGLQDPLLGKLEVDDREPTWFTRFNYALHTAQAGESIHPYRTYGGNRTSSSGSVPFSGGSRWRFKPSDKGAS